MRFEWDEVKRQANLRKHGVDFLDVIVIFEGRALSYEDNRFDYGEQRFITLGLLKADVIVVVHTFAENDTIRIISARKATKYERKQFISSFSN